jgi:hypothetical protein
MTKIYDMHEVVVDGVAFSYFYKRERNDYYGNSRYRVYIIDPASQAVTEKIAKTYEVKDWVRSYIKNPY